MSSDIKWKTVSVGEALTLVNGRAFKPTEWKQTGLPIIRIQNLNNPTTQFNYYDGDLPGKFLVNPGDLLFAWSGTPGTSFGAHIWKNGKAWLNQHIFKVVFDKADFDKRFLQLAINQNLQEYIRQAHGGAGLAHITKGKFEASEIPKPTLDVQEKIVAEIDTQFSRLDEAVASLKRIQANLKLYKAAVLKAAVEGKLTEQWRKDHPAVEPADQLLKRILAERRAKWEAVELAKMKAKVIKPKDDSWKKKYKEPAGTDTANLPELPEEWVWATPVQLDSGEAYATAIGPFGSNLKVSDYRTEGVPLIFVRNIRSLDFTDSKSKYIDAEKSKELRPHWARPGDILITKMGEPPGDATYYPEGKPVAVITADCLKITLSSLIVNNRGLFVHAINSDVVKQQIKIITQGVAQQKISLARFSQIGFPLPPLLEQKVILEEIDRRLAVTEELEITIKTNLKRAERLRQTILQQAFSGGLVS